MDYEKEEQVGYIYICKSIYIIIYFLQLHIELSVWEKK